MSGTLAKHSNALGWAWYLDTDEGSYWVSHPVKEHIDSLEAENAKLREACAELLKMAERHDPEWLHWPELHDELRKLGVKVVKL